MTAPVRAAVSGGDAVNKGGRPSKFQPGHLKRITRLLRKGFTEEEVAVALCVAPSTFREWKTHPVIGEQVSEAVHAGHFGVDGIVRRALLKRAIGMRVKAEKVGFSKDGAVLRAETYTELPPDTDAAKTWLYNRRPDEWKQKLEQNQAPMVVVINAPMILDALAGRDPVDPDTLPTMPVLPEEETR